MCAPLYDDLASISNTFGASNAACPLRCAPAAPAPAARARFEEGSSPSSAEPSSREGAASGAGGRAKGAARFPSGRLQCWHSSPLTVRTSSLEGSSAGFPHQDWPGSSPSVPCQITRKTCADRCLPHVLHVNCREGLRSAPEK